MARTNVHIRTPPLRTHEGTVAKRLTPLQALWRAVVSCMLWEDQFYENGVTIAERIRDLVKEVSFEEAALVARTARSNFKMRHAPLWVAVALARQPGPKPGLAQLLVEIIQRPDELTEFLSLYWKDGKVSLAAQVKRGLAAAFRKFDAYALGKYNRDDAIKLRDVLFLVHARPKDKEQEGIWKQLVEGTLPAPDTWEVMLSGGGDKNATWTHLLLEKKLGALAMLRNLRNMQEAKVDMGLIRQALAEVNVERVLPFRFIAAARYAPQLEDVLQEAMFRCLEGMEKLPGTTAVVMDTSPSMWMAKLSAKSDMDRFDGAAALAVLCREVCQEANVYTFNERAYRVAARRGFALRDAMAATKGSASCGGAAVEMANEDGYDRIIVLTDGQWHPFKNGVFDPMQGHEQPASEVIPDPLTPMAYLINVAAHRNAVGNGKWVMLDGWSEAVIDYVQAYETLM